MGDFLATYLLHSTLLLGTLLLLLKWGRFRQAAARDLVLKVGLLTALGTALIVTFLPFTSAALPPSTLSTSNSVERTLPVQASAILSPKPASHVLQVSSAPAVKAWAAWLFYSSLFFAIWRFFSAWHTLRLAGQEALHDPSILALLSPLQPLAVRLNWTTLPRPCAWGSRHILLPRAAPAVLTTEGLRSVLAHEYAHLLRRDPLWNAALSFLTILFWFQPLNWLALEAWRNAAEEQCDAWAARRTSHLTLAQALLNIAQQDLPAQRLALVSNPASAPTHLTQRITALLHPQEFPMNTTKKLALMALPILLGSLTAPLAVSLQTADRTVVLDAGHGGVDPGAVGFANEAEVVWQITQRVAQQLTAKGVKVIFTPREFTDKRQNIEARAALATLPAKLFVSIHANASAQPNAQGIEVLIDPSQADGKLKTQLQAVAERMLLNMARATAAPNQGVSAIRGYSILRKAQIPAVLVEVGYVTNPTEGKNLNDSAYQHKIADAITQAILDSL